MRRLIWLVCAAAGLCVAVVLIQKFLLGKEEAQQLTAEKVQKQDERAAPSLPGNEQGWIGMGSIPGLHNSLGSIVAHGNTVYAAGTFAFVSAGVQSVKENDKGGSIVVAWNGKEWRSLMRTCDGGYVKALAVTPNGHLYAAGAVCVNGVRVSIGKWDGENWVSVGQGLGNDVHALHVDKQGGLFATGSGATWKWDGVVWRKLGGDIRGRSAGGNAITSDNLGRIYVAGSFDGVGPAKAHNIAIWDGNKWRAIGRGVGGRGGDRGEGGDDGTDQSSAWSIAMSSKSDLYVVSSLGLERWKGNAWELVDIGTEAIANTVFIDKDDRIYVGLVSTCNVEGGPSVGTDKPVQYWDGLKWSSFTLRGSNSGDAPGCDNGGTVSAISGDESGNLYFGGAFADRNSGARNIAKWNGKTLERFGDSKGVNNIVWGLVADRDDNLYAHGAFMLPPTEN